MSDAGNSTKSVIGKPFPPGQSGNPSGRPKGFSTFIRDQTNDGQELAQFALDILRGKKGARLPQRLEALQWLADRGWGKAVQTTELSGPEGGAIVVKGYQTVTPDDWPSN